MAEQQTIQYLAEFHNRYVNLKMKGTWGYNPRNITMLTATSYIEELEVTDMKSFDDEGKKLPSQLIIGTDRYGRYLEIPVDRILEVAFLDTKDQSRLKGLVWLENALKNLDMESIKDNKALKEMIDKSKEEYDKLIAKGVTVYQRRGK